jgi:hypothetical protein
MRGKVDVQSTYVCKLIVLPACSKFTAIGIAHRGRKSKSKTSAGLELIFLVLMAGDSFVLSWLSSASIFCEDSARKERNVLASFFMDLHGSSRIFTDLHGSSRIFTDLHGSSRIFTDLRGPSRSFMDLHGSSRIFTDLHRSSQIFTDLHGSSRIFTDLHRSTRIFPAKHTWFLTNTS